MKIRLFNSSNNQVLAVASGAPEVNAQPVRDNSPLSKNQIMLFGAFFLVVLFGLFIWHWLNASKNFQQVVNVIIQKTAVKPEITSVLGSPIISQGKVEGQINIAQMTGRVVIPVKGPKQSGKLTAAFKAGKMVDLILIPAKGPKVNVLQIELQKKLNQEALAKKLADQKVAKNTFEQALVALQTHRPEKAVDSFLKSIEEGYEAANSYEFLGMIYSQQGQYEKCIYSFTKYLQLSPKSSDAYYQLSYCYLQRFDLHNALVNLDKGCQLGKPESCQAFQQITADQKAHDASTLLAVNEAEQLREDLNL